MAARNCEMAASRSPAFRSLIPELVLKVAACRLVLSALICAPRRASRAPPSLSPNCRNMAASVV